MNENQIQVFTNEQFGKIRTVMIDGEPWFVAKDAALALGYSKPLNAVERHIDEDDSLKRGLIDSVGRTQEAIFINESGLYSLILSSKLPTAKMFKRWVTSEVLPSIRKTGSYATPEAIYKTLIEPKNLIIVLETLAEEQAKNKRLTAENAVLSVKAKYYDQILASSEAMPITQIAKDYGMSAITLNKMLSDLMIQYKRCGTWILYQLYTDKGYTQTRTFVINENQSKSYTCWTQKGRLFLYNVLKMHGILPMCERSDI